MIIDKNIVIKTMLGNIENIVMITIKYWQMNNNPKGVKDPATPPKIWCVKEKAIPLIGCDKVLHFGIWCLAAKYLVRFQESSRNDKHWDREIYFSCIVIT